MPNIISASITAIEHHYIRIPSPVPGLGEVQGWVTTAHWAASTASADQCSYTGSRALTGVYQREQLSLSFSSAGVSVSPRPGAIAAACPPEPCA